MARGRFISNSISTSKKFARLQSNDHRLAYLMLVPHVDAEGRHDADTRILAGQVYTLLDLTHDQIEAALQDMHRVGLIRLYQVDGETYLEVTNFHEHNKVRRRDDGTPSHEAPSIIPPPPAGTQSDSAHMAGATTEELRSDSVAATAEDKVQVQVQVQEEVQEQEPRAHARAVGETKTPSKNGKPKKGRTPTFDPSTVELPEFVSPDVWADFCEHRKAMRRPLTPPAVEGILKDLAKTPLDADAMLRQTITRGWTGVFPLDKDRDKRRGGGGNGGGGSSALDQYREKGL
ncbi:MAG TPA: hypothetical protein VF202_02260 [Trueperaceae bacterium]